MNGEEEKEKEKKVSILTELKNIQTQIEETKTEVLEALDKGFRELKKILTSDEW